jgi:hypothetical protein
MTFRDLLTIRYAEIEAELQWLAERRLIEGDPPTVEAALLAEQEKLRRRLNGKYIERRDAS